jgi:hypothetical protein
MQDHVSSLVTDTSRQRWSRRRFLGGVAGVAALGSFAAACGAAGRPASVPAAGAWTAPGQGTVISPQSAAAGVDAELISRRYGLKPFASPPAPPAVKPVTLSASDPTVFSHVPLTDKVVFTTIDDGAEKEPAFIQMVRDLRVPMAVDLADLFIRDDYAYFEKLYETGFVSIQNHTVNHPLSMPALSAAQQLEEISGQQEKLHQRYGVKPYIFRPPGGNYNETTVGSRA